MGSFKFKYFVSVLLIMKRKSTLVLKKEASLLNQIDEVNHQTTSSTSTATAPVKNIRKRKHPNCSIITPSASSKKRINHALPDIETLLLCPSEEIQNACEDSNFAEVNESIPSSSLGGPLYESDLFSLTEEELSTIQSQAAEVGFLQQAEPSDEIEILGTDSNIDSCYNVHHNCNNQVTLDLSQNSSSAFGVDYFAQSLISESVIIEEGQLSQHDYVQLASTETDQISAKDNCHQSLADMSKLNPESETVRVTGETQTSRVPYVLMVESDPLSGVLPVALIDESSNMLNCDVTLPPAPQNFSEESEDLLERFESSANNSSVDMTLGSNRDERQARITYLLEPSERQRRKGTISDQWEKCPRGRKTQGAELGDNRKPKTFTSQWSDAEVELLKANVENCAEIYKCTPEEIIHSWEKGTRGDFYKIVSTGLNRPLNSIYRKTLRLFPKKKGKSTKFTEAEIDRLIELHKKFGNNWVKIGNEMNRESESVRNKFRCLKLTNHNSGHWADDETERLKDAISSIYGSDEIPSLKMDWTKISKRVKSRTSRQCRFKWIHGLYSKVANSESFPKWSIDDTLTVLESLISSGANNEDEVDWSNLCSQLKFKRTPQWLRRFWTVSLKRMISNGAKIQFQEAVNKLQKFFRECNQLFQSGLDVSEEDLISNYTSSILDYESLNEVLLSTSIEEQECSSIDVSSHTRNGSIGVTENECELQLMMYSVDGHSEEIIPCETVNSI